MPQHNKIKIGISSCLLGEEVRFDGGHKRDRFITDTLSTHVDFVAVCPEVGIGLGVPRQPIQLVGHPHRYRAKGVEDPDLDVTENLVDFARETAARIDNISGYIFKSESPSCGMEHVKLYPADSNQPNRDGVGLYARTIMESMPNLPVEEEDRLNDPALRDNFIERIFTYQRWQELAAGGFTTTRIIEFHTRHKLALLAHGQSGYRSLGRLVANNQSHTVSELAEAYISQLMTTLKRPATRLGHTNVLQHVQGCLKESLNRFDKREITDSIEQYRLGHVPLIVPITLLCHHFKRNPDQHIAGQTYMNPHPPELMLRNSL